MGQTETASPTDVPFSSSATSSCTLARLAGLLLDAEDDEELLLELCSHHAIDNKVGGGVHDNEEPGELSVSRNY